MNFIAHRGNDNHNYQENTKESLLKSIKENYIAGVEFDIRITKDKNFVIYHNMLIEDKKILNSIKNKTLKELKKIKQDITTLEEFLSKVNTNKILLIEIKEESDDFDSLIIKLFNTIKKYKFLNIYICSFNYKLMKKIKSKYKKYKCGLIIGYLINTKNINDDFDFFLYGYNYIDLINYNKEIFIFNINKKEKLNNIKNKVIKPYYIISDKSYTFI